MKFQTTYRSELILGQTKVHFPSIRNFSKRSTVEQGGALGQHHSEQVKFASLGQLGNDVVLTTDQAYVRTLKRNMGRVDLIRLNGESTDAKLAGSFA
ncbi:hypothetical protein [Paucibacter sp. B51]|uniref:hypothetical protein n=1 Tax=Paucibacter sp. B51 TaxID=2993315 RepID=UPI0022EBD96D|nr:hypothetical protein [Paucibacter sp. B51]